MRHCSLMELLKRKKNRKIEVIAQLFQNMKERSDAFMLENTYNQAGRVKDFQIFELSNEI